MKCPVCKKKTRPNKGWAAMFYDGYCNYCDLPVENSIPEKSDSEKRKKEK